MNPNQINNSAQKTIASLIVIIAVVLITVGVKAHDKQKLSAAPLTSNVPQTTSPTQQSTQQSNPATQTSSIYKDGTYSASADYFVPPGQESIKVTLIVRGGLVSDSSIENSQSNPESANFQRDFTSEYKSQVVGKSLASLNLTNVAGASDTTQAFDSALQQIQNQAKV